MKTIKKIKTNDIAIKFRMKAGFAGDVSRTHPVDINAEVADSTYPPTLAGQAVILSTTYGVRHAVAADAETAINIYGITVRTFPFQQAQTSASSYTGNTNFGEAGFTAGIAGGPVDVMRRGYMMVYCNSGTPVKGGKVWVNTQGTSATVGNFEAGVSDANGFLVNNAVWNSGADADGIAEIAFNI
jgi:hypothetical protein